MKKSPHGWSPYQNPNERDEKRGRRPVSELTIEDIRCEKCNLLFESKKEKRQHISQYHRI